MFKTVRFWHHKSMKPEDRRRKIRVPITKTIRHSTYQVLGTPVFQESSAIDLSSTGISFEATREYPKGSLVLLEVEMIAEPVKLLVCVAWTRKQVDGRFLVGAELVAIDPEQRKQLQSHLGKMIKEVEHKNVKKLGSQKKTAKKKIAKKKTSKKKPLKKAKKKTSRKKRR